MHRLPRNIEHQLGFDLIFSHEKKNRHKSLKKSPFSLFFFIQPHPNQARHHHHEQTPGKERFDVRATTSSGDNIRCRTTSSMHLIGSSCTSLAGFQRERKRQTYSTPTPFFLLLISTGASSGIGEACARHFARAGSNLV